MKGTIKELAEQLGVKAVDMNGYINVLLHLGKAKFAGEVPRKTGQKGKASKIYEIEA